MAGELISDVSGYASTEFDTKIPALTDTANIQEAFLLYHYGLDNYDGSTPPSANSIEAHFEAIDDRIIEIENTPTGGGVVQDNIPHLLETGDLVPEGFIWVDGNDTAGATVYSGTVTLQNNEPSSPTNGQVWVDRDYAIASVDVSNYVNYTMWRKIASGGETSLSGNDDNSLPLDYEVGKEQVYLNGILLLRGTDYTATTGTTITGLEALAASDVVVVLQISTAFEIVDTYTQTQSDGLFLTKSSASTTYLTQSSASSTYVTPTSTNTLTNKTLTSPTINTATFKDGVVRGLEEDVNVVASAATGTINLEVDTASIWYYTTNATANHTLNIRYSSSVSLDTALATGDAITVVWMNTNGATAYYPSTIQIDGSTVTPKVPSAISAGNASAIDVYTFTIIKTASATFTVLETQSKFA
jgi:hypothetical protein